MYIFETERLKMREMDREDIHNLMRIFADPVAMQYYTSTFSEERAEAWIDWNLNNYEKHKAGLWICELKETGEFAGQCGIVPQTVDGEQEMEIGYLFVREQWGKGFATEAAIGAKEYGFDKLGLKRLISMIYEPNTPSIRVAERVGMQFEKRTLIKGRETRIYSIHAD